MSAPWAAARASSVRLAWRPLRATSVMPFLWPSSSSSTIIGRKMSCSSKRKRLVGSCRSTLVSSTKSLVGPCGADLRVRVVVAVGGAALAVTAAGGVGGGGRGQGGGASVGKGVAGGSESKKPPGGQGGFLEEGKRCDNQGHKTIMPTPDVLPGQNKRGVAPMPQCADQAAFFRALMD